MIEWADLLAMVDNGETPYILSIRHNDAYNTGHIKGAYNLSYPETLAAQMRMLPTDETVYVYCDTGEVSSQVVAIFNMVGIDSVSVKSGYSGFLKLETAEQYIETTGNEMEGSGVEYNDNAIQFANDYFLSAVNNYNNLISVPDAMDLLASEGAAIMDVRTSQERETGSIKGSVSVPFGNTMQNRFEDFRDKKVVVVSEEGQLSAQTVAVLRTLEIDAVSVESGLGMNGWTGYVMSAAAGSIFDDYSVPHVWGFQNLLDLLSSGNNPYILDIRSQEDYDAGHVTGANHAEWGPDLAEKITLVPKNVPIFVYDSYGDVASQVVVLLHMMGHQEVVYLYGGYEDGFKKANKYKNFIGEEVEDFVPSDREVDPMLLKGIKHYLENVPEGNHMISVDDARTAIDLGEAVVIDFREDPDYHKGHIDEAFFFAVGSPVTAEFGSELAKDAMVIVADYNGAHAPLLAAVLRIKGIDAYALEGGMHEGWIKQGHPVVES